MELEETIERLENIKTFLEIDVGANLELTPRQQKFYAQNLEIVLTHLIKQEKIIELMARCIDTELSSEHLSKVLEVEVKPLETYREDIKQYFKKKAEESE